MILGYPGSTILLHISKSVKILLLVNGLSQDFTKSVSHFRYSYAVREVTKEEQEQILCRLTTENLIDK